eukprot:3340743-Pyramimonas_sp.AAC.1
MAQDSRRLFKIVSDVPGPQNGSKCPRKPSRPRKRSNFSKYLGKLRCVFRLTSDAPSEPRDGAQCVVQAAPQAAPTTVRGGPKNDRRGPREPMLMAPAGGGGNVATPLFSPTASTMAPRPSRVPDWPPRESPTRAPRGPQEGPKTPQQKKGRSNGKKIQIGLHEAMLR